MCTNQKHLQKPSMMTTLIRPRSDPYIPISLLSSVTKNVTENRNRETRSYDDLTATIPLSLSQSFEDCLNQDNCNQNLKKNIVKNCKNCSYSFHVKSLPVTPLTTPGSSCTNSSKMNERSSYSPSSICTSDYNNNSRSSSDEFCCKDCETCYTLFNPVTSVNTTPSKPILKQSTFDVRQSIYAFQQQLLSENQDAINDDSIIEDYIPTACQNEQYEPQHQKEDDPRDLLKAAKKRFNIQYFQTLKQQKQQGSPPTPSSAKLASDQEFLERGNGNVFGWFFNQPKPARPQLHAFI